MWFVFAAALSTMHYEAEVAASGGDYVDEPLLRPRDRRHGRVRVPRARQPGRWARPGDRDLRDARTAAPAAAASDQLLNSVAAMPWRCNNRRKFVRSRPASRAASEIDPFARSI